MYEYEKNPIQSDEDFLKKIDKIEEFKNSHYAFLPEYNANQIAKDNINGPLIEGCLLPDNIARIFFENDVTIRGESIRNYLQLDNHKNASKKYLEKIVNNVSLFTLSVNSILEIHKAVTSGELPRDESGFFRNDVVTLATTVKVPPDYELIPDLVNELIEKYNEPLEYETKFERICEFKRNFERIHPFFDGNGRTGRIIMNALFLQNGYPVVSIPYKRRPDYFNSLENNTFVNFCADIVCESLSKAKLITLSEEIEHDL